MTKGVRTTQPFSDLGKAVDLAPLLQNTEAGLPLTTLRTCVQLRAGWDPR
jgi:hypothetical protein